MGYPNSRCYDLTFEVKHNFGSFEMCQAVMKLAREARRKWCQCASSSEFTELKPNCFVYNLDTVFCAGLPPRTFTADTNTTPPCHVDSGTWCFHPPPEMGWPDSLCESSARNWASLMDPKKPQTSIFTGYGDIGEPGSIVVPPHTDAKECLRVAHKARKIRAAWCACKLEVDPDSPLGLGALFYKGTDGSLRTYSVGLPRRNALERKKLAIANAESDVDGCASYKQSPRDRKLPQRKPITYGQLYDECVSSTAAELKKAQSLPEQ